MEWVSVNDRLPDNEEFVLVNVSGCVSVASLLRYEGGGTDWYDDISRDNDLTNPTHWMPLPKPPKE